MNKIHHFGDSYGGVMYPSIHFVELISEKLGYKYIWNCNGGSSNEMIFSKLLNKIYKFESNDILFLNFSFFIRGSYYDKDTKEIMSTNRFVSEHTEGNTYGKIQKQFYEKDMEFMSGVISYILEYNEDYNRKLFEKFDIIFKLLLEKKISVFYIFNENCNFSDDLLKYGTHIKFNDGFCNWLTKMGYHNQEDCHYTLGIQPNIMEHVFNEMKKSIKII